jgi:predicted transcriptional regulator
MNVKDFAKKYQLKVLTDQLEDRIFTGVYVSDLLSYAIANAKMDGIWVTIQEHINIVAVASLKECAAIIVAENRKIEDHVINKAASENIMLLSSEKDIFEICTWLSKELADE